MHQHRATHSSSPIELPHHDEGLRQSLANGIRDRDGDEIVPCWLVVVLARLHAADAAIHVVLATLCRHRAVDIDNGNRMLSHDRLGPCIEIHHYVVTRVEILSLVRSALGSG